MVFKTYFRIDFLKIILSFFEIHFCISIWNEIISKFIITSKPDDSAMYLPVQSTSDCIAQKPAKGRRKHEALII